MYLMSLDLARASYSASGPPLEREYISLTLSYSSESKKAVSFCTTTTVCIHLYLQVLPDLRVHQQQKARVDCALDVLRRAHTSTVARDIQHVTENAPRELSS